MVALKTLSLAALTGLTLFGLQAGAEEALMPYSNTPTSNGNGVPTGAAADIDPNNIGDTLTGTNYVTQNPISLHKQVITLLRLLLNLKKQVQNQEISHVTKQ